MKDKIKELELRLQESEARFRELFENSPDAILLIDPHNKEKFWPVIDCNEAACQMNGYKRDEIIGESIDFLHPQPESEEYRKNFLNELRVNKKKYYENNHKNKHGDVFTVEVSITLIHLYGKEIVMGVDRDITARKAAEKDRKKYREHLEELVELRTEELQKSYEEIKKLKDKIQNENVYLQEEIKATHNFGEIICYDDKFKKVLTQVELVAKTDSTVLITGETGTGKELVARAIHNISNRRNKTMVKLNCAAIPAALLESELFGHEKGAFTGAVNQKIGKFEIANNSTIFLDEIGEMPVELQPKLLRVLQEGEMERLGGTKNIKINVRVIAATNRNLKEQIQKNEFRKDLYYRLNVFPIKTPPLRERIGDLQALVWHFIEKFNKKINRRINKVSKSVFKNLQSYNWPGNIRELENVIERAVILSPGSTLKIESLTQTNNTSEEEKNIKTLQDNERDHILKVLELTRWRIRGEYGAANILNIKPTTLEARMKKLQISK